MRIFVSAHVIITSIRAPGMFQTFVWFFCCYSAARFSRISLSINGNKGREKSEKWYIIVKLTDGATALAQLLVLYSDRAHSYNQ